MQASRYIPELQDNSAYVHRKDVMRVNEDVTTSKQLGLGKIKRWILPGEGKSKILAIIGGKATKDVKFIYKKYGVKASQHVTLMITNDGRVDIHLTEEAKEKKYTSLFKGYVDITYLKKQAETLYRKSLKPIDIKNPLYSSFYVLVPKSVEAYVEFYHRSYVKGDRIVLPTTKREEEEIDDYLEGYFDIFRFDDVSGHRILFGLCVNEKGDMGILMSDKENHYFFSITEALNIFVNSIKHNLLREQS